RHPVTGLTAADFTIFQNGKSMPIAAFSEVHLPPATTTVTGWTHDVVPDVVTNATPDEGRLVVVVLDRSIPAGEPPIVARRIATTVIDQLGPTDLAAITFTKTATPQDFTSNRQLLLRAINGSDPGMEGTADDGTADAGILTTSVLMPGDCYCGLCVP